MSPHINDRLVATTMHHGLPCFNGTERIFYKVVSDMNEQGSFLVDRVQVQRVKDTKNLCYDVSGCMWSREEVIPLWDEVMESGIVLCEQVINVNGQSTVHITNNNFHTVTYVQQNKRYYEFVPHHQYDFSFSTLVYQI